MNEILAMRAVTIKEAKAKLNELIEAAANGEDVVILRGSEHVAAIIPITAADLELSPRITDEHARRLWSRLESERAAGRTLLLDTAEEAVGHLLARADGASVAREGRGARSVAAKSVGSPKGDRTTIKRRRAKRAR